MSSQPIPYSLSAKPPSPQQQRLRLRSGSVSAPDPWATHTSPLPQSVFSKLSIVRVPSGENVDDIRDSRTMSQRRRSVGHSHTGSWGSHASTGSSPSSPVRVSFAASSFSSKSPTRTREEGPRHRSDSLLSTHRRSGSFGRLNPEEICDIARASCNPRSDPFSTPLTSLASFSEVPDDVYLPFLDRPTEVTALMSETNNAKLLKLLEHSLAKPSEGTQPSAIPEDPSKWTIGHLQYWLTHVDRKEANDYVWIRKMRGAIHPRSELIWQRLKEVLGAPVDFDVDDEDESNASSSITPSPSTPDGGAFSEIFSPSPEPHLDIEPIRAKPPSPHHESLHEIKEDEPAIIENATDALYGLRISLPASDAPVQLVKPISPHSPSDNTTAYDALEERGPGNPLFPSNFRGVALAPTLPANKPKSHSRSSSRSDFYPQFLRPGRTSISDLPEYAVTTSSSSVYSLPV